MLNGCIWSNRRTGKPEDRLKVPQSCITKPASTPFPLVSYQCLQFDIPNGKCSNGNPKYQKFLSICREIIRNYLSHHATSNNNILSIGLLRTSDYDLSYPVHTIYNNDFQDSPLGFCFPHRATGIGISINYNGPTIVMQNETRRCMPDRG